MKKSDRKLRDFFSFLIANRGNISMGFCFFFFNGRENLFFWPFVLTNGKNR